MIKYPSTYAYREFVHNTKFLHHKVALKGTVKIHGTNAGVRFPDNIPQSRNKVLTVEDDNYGFAKFHQENKEVFAEIYRSLLIHHNLMPRTPLVIFGEWAGKGIQDTVGISKLDKRFYIFNIGIVYKAYYDKPKDDTNKERPEEKFYWLSNYKIPHLSKDIVDVGAELSFHLTYDPNDPEDLVESLEKLTEVVSKECPIARLNGVEGPGEGVVWQFIECGEKYTFKVKGTSHTTSKLLKRKVTVDPEKFEKIERFIDEVFTTELFDNIYAQKEYKNRLAIGTFIKDVLSDVFREEKDTIAISGFNNKELSNAAISKVKKYILGKFE